MFVVHYDDSSIQTYLDVNCTLTLANVLFNIL